MFSIVIPAHNEAASIGSCLTELLRGLRPDEAEVIVACNACTDRTADIARQFPGVTVLEIATAGKANALNVADGVAGYFPRIYLDADVRMSAGAARELARVLSRGDVHAASPSLRVDLQGRSWPLRAYYNIWMRLPYCTQGMVGAGVYALSRAGRARFETFPDVLAEDDFIRLLFAPAERRCLPDRHFTIAAPTSFASLLKLRRRWERGNRQIDTLYQPSRRNDRRDYRGVARQLLCTPSLWADLAVYLFVIASSRTAAAAQLRFSRNPWQWSRDDSARIALGRSGARD